jgi:hypothetical protein
MMQKTCTACGIQQPRHVGRMGVANCKIYKCAIEDNISYEDALKNIVMSLAPGGNLCGQEPGHLDSMSSESERPSSAVRGEGDDSMASGSSLDASAFDQVSAMLGSAQPQASHVSGLSGGSLSAASVSASSPRDTVRGDAFEVTSGIQSAWGQVPPTVMSASVGGRPMVSANVLVHQ